MIHDAEAASHERKNACGSAACVHDDERQRPHRRTRRRMLASTLAIKVPSRCRGAARRGADALEAAGAPPLRVTSRALLPASAPTAPPTPCRSSRWWCCAWASSVRARARACAAGWMDGRRAARSCCATPPHSAPRRDGGWPSR
eukprot:scaffold3241_cov319-Prasinococcus_capsulatus_cf.AAC.3